MNLKEKNTALILIDIQKGFEDEQYWGGNRNNKDAEENCAILLEKWRNLDLPIFHIRHSSQNPNSLLHKSNKGFEIQDIVKPLEKETIVTKNVNSAFIGTNLKELLDKQNIKELVIVGLITNHCISTTTRMAGNMGYDVFLISDATATFDFVGINGERFSSQLMHETELACLKDEFAKVLSTEELLKLLD